MRKQEDLHNSNSQLQPAVTAEAWNVSYLSAFQVQRLQEGLSKSKQATISNVYKTD